MKTADLLPAEMIEDDPLLDAAAQLQQASRHLDLEPWIVHRLNHAEREITVNLGLRRDAADSLNLSGFRIQHSRPRAGCLGPVVLSPGAHLAQLRPLALQITLQCALFDVLLGGSAGAIVCDPAQLTERELRHLVRQYLAALDTRGDIFAPAEFPAAFTAAASHLAKAALVGKPAIVGGIPDMPAAMAAGWFTLISDSFATHQQPLAGCRVGLQGFGAAARKLAFMLQEGGARIVGLADKSGGLYAERGLDLGAVTAHVQQHEMLYGFENAEPVSNSDVLESECDVVIAAAAERQINAQNAPRVHASLVLDAVPNAVTPAATAALSSRAVEVIPALLGSAPRTLAWFVEWQHGLQAATPDQPGVEEFIQRRMSAVFHQVHASGASNNIALPGSSLCLALEKLSCRWRATQ